MTWDTCGKCKWFERRGKYVGEKFIQMTGLSGKPAGRCIKRPPTNGGWPIVEERDTCGEFDMVVVSEWYREAYHRQKSTVEGLHKEVARLKGILSVVADMGPLVGCSRRSPRKRIIAKAIAKLEEAKQVPSETGS